VLIKPEHIEENVRGSAGIVSAGKEGLILIEMSTMHPAWSAGLAADLDSRNVYMVDAPVSGTVPHVKSRTLSYMVGGEKEVYNRILPVVGPLAKNVTYAGKNGSACAMKLVTNLIVNAGLPCWPRVFFLESVQVFRKTS